MGKIGIEYRSDPARGGAAEAAGRASGSADQVCRGGVAGEPGVVTGEGTGVANDFLAAIGQHRFWDRQLPPQIPA